MGVKGNLVGIKSNYVYTDSDSHFFTDLQQILNFITYYLPKKDKFNSETSIHYLKIGIENSIKKGYVIENIKKNKKKRRNI